MIDQTTNGASFQSTKPDMATHLNVSFFGVFVDGENVGDFVLGYLFLVLAISNAAYVEAIEYLVHSSSHLEYLLHKQYSLNELESCKFSRLL